jgi:SH3-like domain-containing protein
MSGSASAPPKKLVFPPVAPPEPVAEPVVAPPIRRTSALLPIVLGVLVIVGGLAFLLIEREPEIEVLDLAAAVNLTANTLNVRAGPSARADRLADRTLRKRATVTEECRAGEWSRVRLVDGRSGWVSNEYLAPATVKN